MTHLHKFYFVVLTLLVLAPVATAVNAQTPPRKRAAQKSAGATVLFSPASGSPVTVGVTPSAIATADLNRDGSADFLAANKTGNSVSVRLGNSSGFTAASDVPVGTPVDIATGDVNQDGKLDFLVIGQSAAKVFVWLGDGAGAFTAGDSILIGLQPVSLALGDFNGDGKTDVIVLRSAGDFFVRLGDGAGGFPTSSSFGTGFPNASDITAADFDNDGDLDLFIVNTSNTLITIARNDGGSGFASQTNFQIGVGTNPNVVAAADINNDGAQDFLTVNTGNNTVAVFLGDATGGFLYGEVIPVGPGASDIKLADFNGDGNLDFLTANAGDNSATLGLGDGTGGFTTQPLTAGIAGQPDRLAVADVNNDGKLDFFINSPETNAVAVLQNGIVFDVTTFTAPRLTALGNQPQAIAAADLNHDGHLDFLTANTANDNVSVRLGAGDGSFNTTRPTVSVGNDPLGLAIADINNDGDLDFLVANDNASSDNVSVRLGDGTGNFTSSTDVFIGSNPWNVAAADIDHDGDIDMAVTRAGTTSVAVRLGDGTGSFTGTTLLSGSGSPRDLEFADINNDGDVDLLVTNIGGNVSVWLGDGSGGFTAATDVQVGTDPFSLAVADINKDGKLDLLVANRAFVGTVSVRLGDGAGNFANTNEIDAGVQPYQIATADVDRDGNVDFVTVSGNGSVVRVRYGDGTGNFAGSSNIFTTGGPSDLVLADVNEDGKPDMLTANVAESGVGVWLNLLPTAANWNFITLPGNPLAALNGLSANAAGAFTTVGDSGYIFTSPDAINWTAQTSGVPQNLNSVVISDDFNPVARKSSGAQSVNGFGSAVAVGVGGTILRSADGGTNWAQITVSGITSALNSVAIPNTGSSANKQGRVSGTQAFGVAVAVGDGGTILRSGDGGATWSAATVGTTTLNSVALANDFNPAVSFGSAIATGTGGKILRSTDGGVSWNSIDGGVINTLNSVAYYGASAVVSKENGTQGTEGFGSAVAVGVGGTILRSADGGSSWVNLSGNLNVQTNLQSVGMVDADNWYVSGENGEIYKTTNGGAAWTNLSAPTGATINIVTVLSSGNSVAVGIGGTVLQSPNGGISSVRQEDTAIPDAFTLSQNYPNPFNPNTSIRYQLLASSEVRLKVYDVLGREVATLVNAKQAAGSYAVNFNAARLSSGVYFYRLIASGQANTTTLTKKMLLIK